MIGNVQYGLGRMPEHPTTSRPDTGVQDRPPSFRHLRFAAARKPAREPVPDLPPAPHGGKQLPLSGRFGPTAFLGKIRYFLQFELSALSGRDDIAANRQQLALINSMQTLGCASCDYHGDACDCLRTIIRHKDGNQYPAACIRSAFASDGIRRDRRWHNRHDRAAIAIPRQSLEESCHASSASDIASQLGP